MKDTVLAKKVIRKEINGDVLIATAEFSSIGDQAPYFSITADLYDRGPIRGEAHVTNSAGKTRWLGSCGQLTDEVAEHIPELAPYLRWHLTSTAGPMHYLANALYHAGFCLGMERSRNLEYLRSTIVYGAVEGDTDINLEALDAEQLKQWLTDRFPRLMVQFRADINALFGKEVVTVVETEVAAYTGTLSTPHNREVMRQKKRQDLIDRAATKAKEDQTELEGILWAFDHGLDIDNLIYYTHRQIFTFGWNKPVSDSERSAILDVISEFPFEYEIKAQDKVYSGRE